MIEILLKWVGTFRNLSLASLKIMKRGQSQDQGHQMKAEKPKLKKWTLLSTKTRLINQEEN